MKTDKFFITGCLIFALFVRLIFLNDFPIGMTHDELNNIFAAKSLFLTHSFPPGTAPAILPTNISNFTVTVPEVPTIILAPFIGLLPMSMFAGRVVGSLLSVLAILAMYLIVLSITKKRLFAQIVLLLMAINPWSFLMGRTIAELNFFIVFFLWGFLVLLKSKGWKIFYALPFYLLGFFSYTGGQIAFFAFVIISLIYRYFIYGNKRDLKIYVIFVGIFLFVFAGYVYIATHNQSFKARGAELYLLSSPQISAAVDAGRKLSVQSPLTKLFINKATVYVSGFMAKYLNAFSPDNLFLTGETRAIFSYQTHGTFYLIDFLFIIIGLSSLYALNKKSWVLFTAVILGCSVTSGLSVVENSYSQRAGLIFPFLVAFSAIGIGSTILAAKSKRIRLLASVFIAVIYLLSFANLMYIYFVRFPVYASDGWFFQDRVLARYVSLTQKTFPEVNITVYTTEPKIVFEEFLFYTNLYNAGSAGSINQEMSRSNYSYGGVSFTDKCPDKTPVGNQVVITDGSFDCKSLSGFSGSLHISRLKDVYADYVIYNDKICKNYVLPRYIPISSYGNFNVESQSVESFCTGWITKVM